MKLRKVKISQICLKQWERSLEVLAYHPKKEECSKGVLTCVRIFVGDVYDKHIKLATQAVRLKVKYDL